MVASAFCTDKDGAIHAALTKRYLGVYFGYIINRRGKMPIFKALASIIAWVLFIFAWIIGLSVYFHGIIIGDIYGTAPPSMSTWAGSAVALGFGVGAVVVMRLRQKME